MCHWEKKKKYLSTDCLISPGETDSFVCHFGNGEMATKVLDKMRGERTEGQLVGHEEEWEVLWCESRLLSFLFHFNAIPHCYSQASRNGYSCERVCSSMGQSLDWAGLPVTTQKEDGPELWCCYSVSKSCLTPCDPMDCSMPGFPVQSVTFGACWNSCPLSQWYHPTISSSVVSFSSCLQSFPASESLLKFYFVLMDKTFSFFTSPF